ncbi:MAG TPA: TolC family protein [Bryobacteraceae bacterium]|nr:TolC family protein [Bryobacteraceae bacterium]
MRRTILLFLTGMEVFAQTRALTVGEAVESALRNYPSVHVSQEQLNAAAARIDLARTAYLPRVDALAQFNRATRNNVTGLLLPQNAIPSISGPVLGTNNLGTVWGSAAGALVSWEPFDFGFRGANVAAASAARSQAEAALKHTQYDVAVAAGDAYLTLVAAEQTTRAAEAAVSRAEVISRSTQALVDAELRPGADASRAQAELAAARTQLIQARQAVEVSRASVAQFLAIEPAQVTTASDRLLQLPPETIPAPLDTAANPIVQEQDAVIAAAMTRLRILERSYFPRFYLQGAAYSRGTGAETDGRRLGGLNGLGPNVQDYALGVTITFPIMDRASIHAREAEESATIRAETARAQQIALDLKAQWNRAVAAFNGARQVAANTPVELMSARAAVDQASARYQSGLGTIDAVAEAQRLLTQAEIDDALARLGIWRGLFGIAAAAGDLQPFLTEASQ